MGAAWLKALILWLGIPGLAIVNGALREKLLVPAFGSFAGLIASGAILSVCIFLVALAAVPWWGRLEPLQWWSMGAGWLLLTLAFESGFGRFAEHKTWAEIFEAYTFKGGNIWPLVPAATLVSPWLAAKVRGFVELDNRSVTDFVRSCMAALPPIATTASTISGPMPSPGISVAGMLP